MSANEKDPQLSLHDFNQKVEETSSWPPLRRFPHNADGKSVEDIVTADLLESDEPCIITGFASLDRIIRFLPAYHRRDDIRVRILLGHEPHVSEQSGFSPDTISISEEVRDYWLERGVSVALSYPLIQSIELIEEGGVEFRTSSSRHQPVHAKIYSTESAVTLGSSNFSVSGLQRQKEANVRYDDPNSDRFNEGHDIAEQLWKEADDYTDEMLDLLDNLLKVVRWEEALARACAELLEGEWVAQYIEPVGFADPDELWPSQRAGLAQALWIIENVGSVLIADATGSGKTKMTTWLLLALQNRIFEVGRRRLGPRVMCCPPAVEQHWRQEFTNCELDVEPYSHGQLSHQGASLYETIQTKVDHAHVLVLDEAHNFTNPGSNRTQRVMGSPAEHVVLLTATPINRSVHDMVALLNLLGPDNLDDEARDILEQTVSRGGTTENLAPETIRKLRQSIGRFTVRRTKRQLNRAIDRQPEEYTNHEGDRCRFPKHVPRTYPLEEPDTDRRLAREIRKEADRLSGLIWLGDKLELTEAQAHFYDSEEAFTEAVKKRSAGLARHHVLASLRSSPAALVEHIAGTDEAVELFELDNGFSSKKKESGDQLATLEELAGSPPENRLTIDVEPWLVDPEAHRDKCAEERRIYEVILEKTRQLSAQRITEKAALLRNLLNDHDLVLAFDARPITLACIRKKLLPCEDTEVLVASGTGKSGRKRIQESFALGSDATNTVALCTDSMSEGVNLQRASAIVNLDMPSVIRSAEQRAGRVDRMDSPHESVEIWWPDDADEFALKTDELLVRRHNTVQDLLGSNIKLPDRLQQLTQELKQSDRVHPQKMHALVTERLDETDWDGISDAFEPIRKLFEGANPLIDAKLYDELKDSEARIVSRVGLVQSSRPWAFFTVAASDHTIPRWVFFESPRAEPTTEIRQIARLLRERLEKNPQNVVFTKTAAEWIARFCNKLADAERALLPIRKQKALSEMKDVLTEWMPDIGQPNFRRRRKLYDRLIKLTESDQHGFRYDPDAVADKWLQLNRPIRRELLRQKGRRKLVTIEDCSKLLLEDPLSDDELTDAFGGIPKITPIQKRVVVTIVGVPAP